MATFESSWGFSGATGILRLVIQDPPAATPGQTSMSLSAWLYLVTNGRVVDSSNSNEMTGAISQGAHAVSVNHAAYPTGGTTLIASGSGTFGMSTNVAVNGIISGYDAFPGTKTVSGSVNTPAYISAATTPGQCGVYSQGVIQSAGTAVLTAPASDGGSPITSYQTFILYNNAWPDSGGVPVPGGQSDTWYVTSNSLAPLTRYYITGRAWNAVGPGPWATMQVIDTTESGFVKVGGAWRQAQGSVKVGGAWRTIQQTYVNVGGTWRSW